jgi:hypothetical protein
MNETRIKMTVLQDMRSKVYDMMRSSQYTLEERNGMYIVAMEITKYIQKIIDMPTE